MSQEDNDREFKASVLFKDLNDSARLAVFAMRPGDTVGELRRKIAPFRAIGEWVGSLSIGGKGVPTADLHRLLLQPDNSKLPLGLFPDPEPQPSATGPEPRVADLTGGGELSAGRIVARVSGSEEQAKGDLWCAGYEVRSADGEPVLMELARAHRLDAAVTGAVRFLPVGADSAIIRVWVNPLVLGAAGRPMSVGEVPESWKNPGHFA